MLPAPQSMGTYYQPHLSSLGGRAGSATARKAGPWGGRVMARARPGRTSSQLGLPCLLPTTAPVPAGARDLGKTKTTFPLGLPNMGARDYDGKTEAQPAEWVREVCSQACPRQIHLPFPVFLMTVLWHFLVCRELLFVTRLAQSICVSRNNSRSLFAKPLKHGH